MSLCSRFLGFNGSDSLFPPSLFGRRFLWLISVLFLIWGLLVYMATNLLVKYKGKEFRLSVHRDNEPKMRIPIMDDNDLFKVLDEWEGVDYTFLGVVVMVNATKSCVLHELAAPLQERMLNSAEEIPDEVHVTQNAPRPPRDDELFMYEPNEIPIVNIEPAPSSPTFIEPPPSSSTATIEPPPSSPTFIESHPSSSTATIETPPSSSTAIPDFPFEPPFLTLIPRTTRRAMKFIGGLGDESYSDESDDEWSCSRKEEEDESDDISLDSNDDFLSDEHEENYVYESTEHPHSKIYQGRAWALMEDGSVSLQLFDQFPNKNAFQMVVVDYCVQEGFDLCKLKNEPNRYIVVCKGELCDWRIHASLLPDGCTWAIKTLSGEHVECSRVQKNTLADYK